MFWRESQGSEGWALLRTRPVFDMLSDGRANKIRPFKPISEARRLPPHVHVDMKLPSVCASVRERDWS